jgi:hypothetical protein
VASLRFYTDEHIARAVIRGLRQRGIDVLTVPDADMLGASDKEHLALALRTHRVVLTQDTNFLRLAATEEHHAGIVFAPKQKSIGEIIQGVMLIYQTLDVEDMIDAVEYL